MMSFATAPPRPALTDVQIEQQKQFTSRVIQEKIFTVHLREFRKAVEPVKLRHARFRWLQKNKLRNTVNLGCVGSRRGIADHERCRSWCLAVVVSVKEVTDGEEGMAARWSEPGHGRRRSGGAEVGTVGLVVIHALIFGVAPSPGPLVCINESSVSSSSRRGVRRATSDGKNSDRARTN